MAVLLEVRNGPTMGAMHPVLERATIGRGTSADVVIPDIAVSRLHASVRVDGQTCVVEDLDSSNGTLVNGEEIARSKGLAAEPLPVAEDVDIAGTLVELARDRRAAAIVVGSRGLGGLRARL